MMMRQATELCVKLAHQLAFMLHSSAGREDRGSDKQPEGHFTIRTGHVSW